MTEAARLTFPLRLTIGEMAFLLSLTGVQQFIGLEQTVLFPSDEAERGRLLLAGRDLLLERKLLLHEPETGRYDLNLALTAVITTVAAPDAVVTTTLRSGNLSPQHVVHSIARLPVEIAFDGQAFLLAGLDSLDTMLARLANTLQLPAAAPPAGEVTLTSDEVKTITTDPAALSGRGVAIDRARSLASALLGDGRQAVIRISHVHHGQAATTSQLRVLAVGTTTPWMAVPLVDRRVAFSLADQPGFAAALEAMLTQQNGAPDA